MLLDQLVNKLLELDGGLRHCSKRPAERVAKELELYISPFISASTSLTQKAANLTCCRLRGRNFWNSFGQVRDILRTADYESAINICFWSSAAERPDTRPVFEICRRVYCMGEMHIIFIYIYMIKRNKAPSQRTAGQVDEQNHSDSNYSKGVACLESMSCNRNSIYSAVGDQLLMVKGRFHDTCFYVLGHQK